MTQTRRRLAVVVAAAVALGVAGCDDGTPVAEPSSDAPSASASPTASPDPSAPVVTKPERPAAANQNTQAGAEAAAIYFLELDSYMQATGDTSEWKAMSHKECGYCAGRAKQAEEISAAGYVWSGRTTAMVTKTHAQDPATGIWPIDVHIRDAATTVVDQEGNPVFEAPADEYDRRVEIAQRDATWVVIGVVEVDG